MFSSKHIYLNILLQGNPGRQLSTIQPLAHFLHTSAMGQRKRGRIKSRIFVGQDKNRLTNKREVEEEKKEN